MEILNRNAALLSNNEVYSLLKQTKENLAIKLIKKKSSSSSSSSAAAVNQEASTLNVDKHLSTIVYESLRYLEKTACVNQTSYIVGEFLRKCSQDLAKSKDIKLTKIEKLQLLNHRPNTSVDLQYLIEDSEERFSLEQMDDLLEFVQNNLPNSVEQQQPIDEDQVDAELRDAAS
jgi:DNA-directed RNA polymerase subunit F